MSSIIQVFTLSHPAAVTASDDFMPGRAFRVINVH